VATAKKASKTAKAGAKKTTRKAPPPAEPEAWATPAPAPAAAPTAAWQAAPGMRPDEERTYAMLLHLSALAGLLIGGGFILGPLIMWLIKKESSPFVDRHGRTAVNFHLSLLAYAIGGAVLIGIIAIATLGLGVLLLIPVIILGAIALAVLAVVFPIMACLRAQAGLEYTYPMSIRFIPPPGTP
jgi:uncharacterized Tic20 family protein